MAAEQPWFAADVNETQVPILVHHAIVLQIAFATDVMQRLQKLAELLKTLQLNDVLIVDLLFRFLRDAASVANAAYTRTFRLY